MDTQSQIQINRSKIAVDEIQDSFKKGLRQAQLRQVVISSYPSARIGNEFKDSLYSEEQLGITSTPYQNERVTWIPVAMDATKEQVQADLDKVLNACIYRIISLKPIISSDQKRVIENGLSGDAFADFKLKNNLTKDSWDEECSAIVMNGIADRQTVRYGEGNDAQQPADAAVLFNGKIQYKELAFSMTERADIDLRVEEKQVIPSIALVAEEKEEEVVA